MNEDKGRIFMGGGKAERFFSLSTFLGALAFAKAYICCAYWHNNVVAAFIGSMQPCVCSPTCRGNTVKGWYVCHEDDTSPDKRFFLENIGLEVAVLSYY